MSRTMHQKIAKWLMYNVFILGCIIILTAIGISFGKDFIKSQKIKREITSLQNDISNIEKKNFELMEFIKYLDSEIYAEKKARMELGLKKPDEKVIIVPKGEEEKIINEEQAANNIGTEEPNIKKWWKYFFSKNKYDS